MNAELWVQSPRLHNRRINFLRYNKRVAEGQWAVMDVSVDGILGPSAGRRTTDATAVANNTTGCRLLPSGCLIEDMGKGNDYCKVYIQSNSSLRVLLLQSLHINSNYILEVRPSNLKFSLALQITWVVHAEYDETMVPTLFRPLLRSGKAFGAHRWLASLQRQYEYLTILHSSQVPRGDKDNTGESCHGQQGNCRYITFDFIFHMLALGLISWNSNS